MNPKTGQRLKADLDALVETKGCWNQYLKTSMKSQLRERYLKKNDLTHGIYLVGWYLCDDWDGDNDYKKSHVPRWSLDEAKQFFTQQAEEISEGLFNIRAFVLNACVAEH